MPDAKTTGRRKANPCRNRPALLCRLFCEVARLAALALGGLALLCLASAVGMGRAAYLPPMLAAAVGCNWCLGAARLAAAAAGLWTKKEEKKQ